MIGPTEELRPLVPKVPEGREVTGGPGTRGAVDRAVHVASCEREPMRTLNGLRVHPMIGFQFGD